MVFVLWGWSSFAVMFFYSFTEENHSYEGLNHTIESGTLNIP